MWQFTHAHAVNTQHLFMLITLSKAHANNE